MRQNLHSILRKIVLLSVLTCFSNLVARASTGDTIIVRGFDHFLHQNCNSGDSTFLFPPDSMSFYKIMLRYELSCPPIGCDIYDRIATLKVKRHTGVIDSTLTLAPSFKVNGNVVDSLRYMADTSYQYTYNHTSHLIDSTALASLQVILFNDSLDPLQATDTLTVWPAYYNQYTFDTAGTATDSVFVTPDSILYLVNDSIYTPFEVIDPFEIARAITPYGEGVVLWFDVSDYRTLLHDSVELYSVACGYSNGWEVTTDFYYIEGIPPMHPYKITNLWNGTFAYGKLTDPIDNHLQPITLQVDSQAVYEKVRLITTGHGFGGNPNQAVAEFYNVTHTLLVNGTQLNQHLWRSDCGRNPLYPQGAPGYTSTWFYKRANWCPGSYVTPHDYNATPLVGANDTLIVDYNMHAYTVTGGPAGFYAPEYYIQSQAIYYDDLHYTNNAALLEVRQPNGAFEFNRMNPICEAFNPNILIRNYGTDTLHQLTIHYGVDGSYSNSYSWTGNLMFTDTVAISLPAISFGSGVHSFDVYIEQPNGTTDGFAYDDTMHTTFTATNIYNANYLRIQVKTDNTPSSTSWTVKNDQGVTIASRTSFGLALTTYTDTVMLPNGCFTFKIVDAGATGDGICCYNGAGNLKLYAGSSPTTLVNNGDFGEYYALNFTLDFQNSIDEPALNTQIFIYPNPASRDLTLNTTFEIGHLLIDVLDMTGRIVSGLMEREVYGHSTQINLPDLSDGIYYLRIRKNGEVFVKKVVIANN